MNMTTCEHVHVHVHAYLAHILPASPISRPYLPVSLYISPGAREILLVWGLVADHWAQAAMTVSSSTDVNALEMWDETTHKNVIVNAFQKIDPGYVAEVTDDELVSEIFNTQGLSKLMIEPDHIRYFSPSLRAHREFKKNQQRAWRSLRALVESRDSAECAWVSPGEKEERASNEAISAAQAAIASPGLAGRWAQAKAQDGVQDGAQVQEAPLHSSLVEMSDECMRCMALTLEMVNATLHEYDLPTWMTDDQIIREMFVLIDISRDQLTFRTETLLEKAIATHRLIRAPGIAQTRRERAARLVAFLHNDTETVLANGRLAMEPIEISTPHTAMVTGSQNARRPLPP